jgi:hypothetical protein
LSVATGGFLSLFGVKKFPSWTRLTANAVKGATTLTVENYISWTPGTKFILATTDFSEIISSGLIPPTSSVAWQRGLASPDQSEVLTVASVSGKVITVKEPLKFLHWGTGLERAEVGLLTRQIVIQGDEDSLTTKFGGHMIMKHANLQISGVEVTRMGKLST